MLMHFSGYGVNSVYVDLIENTMNSEDVPVARSTAASQMTREIHPLVVELKRPRQRLVTAFGRPVNVAFALAEVLWILDGHRDVEMVAAYNSTIANYSDDGKVFNAAYGYRLRDAFGLDQLDSMVETLAHDRTSRQAVMAIWHPLEDNPWRDTKDRACNLTSHAMIRNGKLDWMQIMRSNDALWGVPYNWIQWTHIQEYVAHRLELDIGKYYHIADSFHIYDHQWDEANAIYPFDIYEHLPEHLPINFDSGQLKEVAQAEECIRAGKDYVCATDDWYWQTCVALWQAHMFYKQGEDEHAYTMLVSAPDRVYAAAQCRFYWHWRWNKKQQFASSITAFFPGAVAAWIMGEQL